MLEFHWQDLIFLLAAGFIGAFIDAAVGGGGLVKHNIVYILCKHILYVLCKDIVYKFSLISGQFFPLGEDHRESKRPFSSGTPVYLH